MDKLWYRHTIEYFITMRINKQLYIIIKINHHSECKKNKVRIVQLRKSQKQVPNNIVSARIHSGDFFLRKERN